MRDEAGVCSFKDRWKGGLNHYIEWMRDRGVISGHSRIIDAEVDSSGVSRTDFPWEWQYMELVFWLILPPFSFVYWPPPGWLQNP